MNASTSKHELRDLAALDLRLKPTDFRLLHVLLMHRNDRTRACFPSAETLAQKTGLKGRTLRDCLCRLREAGYVDWLKGAPGRANSYWFSALGDPEIKAKRTHHHRRGIATDEKTTAAVSRQCKERNTGSLPPQHRRDIAVNTGGEPPPNTLIEHENELGTGAPAARRVPEISSSGSNIEAQFESLRDTSEFDAEHYLWNLGLDEPSPISSRACAEAHTLVEEDR